MLKCDRWITEQAGQGMIEPFQSGLVRHLEPEQKLRPVLSFGCSSYGYDLRLSPQEFLIFRHVPGTVMNPKRFNPANLELGLLVFVEITLSRTSTDIFDAFRQAVIDLPQVLECHLVSGNFDYLIKARVADMAAYRQLLGETLLPLPGVSDSRTYVVMEEVKEDTPLPL